jgi:hypothetical protein
VKEHEALAARVENRPHSLDESKLARPLRSSLSAVIAGLDPAIHRLGEKALVAEQMDPRVKPAGDGLGFLREPSAAYFTSLLL